ncbi:MAG TPA: cupin domain-containing protein [Chthoniobacterales bacterium]|nr:cupin domain-containing protein [Chthoniobacterales bacterium]
MNRSNINLATEWFEVLQTTERSQTAVMRLDPGQSTGEHAESHDKSEQLLLLLEGRLMADIGGKILAMSMGDVVIIPPRVKHKLLIPATPGL